MDIVEKFPNKPWRWFWISSNPNITMDIIEKYPDKPWDWAFISSNPNLTMEFIEKYPDKPWNWNTISHNQLFYHINYTLWYYKNRKLETIKHIEFIKQELLGVTWEPSRFKSWCLSLEEQQDLENRWK